MGSQTTAERSHLAYRYATCCLRRSSSVSASATLNLSRLNLPLRMIAVHAPTTVTDVHATLATGRRATALPSRTSTGWTTPASPGALRSFFLACVRCVLAGALNDVQLHDGVFQQPQGPLRPSFRRRRTSGRSVSPRPRRRRCVVGPVRGMLARQDGLEAFFDQPLAGAVDRRRADI